MGEDYEVPNEFVEWLNRFEPAWGLEYSNRVQHALCHAWFAGVVYGTKLLADRLVPKRLVDFVKKASGDCHE